MVKSVNDALPVDVSAPVHARRPRPVTSVVLFVLASLLVLLAVEGAMDLLFVLGRPRPAGPRLDHLVHDPALGWRSRPGFADAGYYGPGGALTVDGAGHRIGSGRSDPSAGGSAGVVCLGGAATFGSGLGDGQTWPAMLEGIDRKLRVVNLGEEGYSVRQSRLRYLGDGRGMPHRTVVLAVTGDDPAAIRDDSFFGWQRPRANADQSWGQVLKTRTSAAAAGSNVSRRTAPGIALRRMLAPLAELRGPAALSLAGRPLRDLARPVDRLVVDPEVGRLLTDAIRDLAADVRAGGRQLVVLYLPSRAELEEPRMHHVRRLLHRDVPGTGALLVDFAESLEKLGPAAWPPLFAEADRPGALTPQGASILARDLYSLLELR